MQEGCRHSFVLWSPGLKFLSLFFSTLLFGFGTTPKEKADEKALIKILLSFIYFHIIPNLYELINSVEKENNIILANISFCATVHRRKKVIQY